MGAIRVTSAGLDGRILPCLCRADIMSRMPWPPLRPRASSTFPRRKSRQALAEFQNLHQRSEILTLPGEVTVINDCYNSNPLAMERMLETLAAWPGARRRIVVAGEMLELGPTSPELHRDVGRKCAPSGVEWVIAVQGDAQFFVEGAVEGGIPPSHARFFPDAKSAGEFCQTLIAPGDVILVKGSRGVHLETVIEMLKRQESGSQESEVRSQKSESKVETSGMLDVGARFGESAVI